MKLIALTTWILTMIAFSGCNPATVAATDGIEIVSVRLEDWRNPADGESYLVALPTWRNSGTEAVQQVTFMATVDRVEAQQPKNDPKEPHYFGSPVEPGTEVKPTRVPEDGVVLGKSEELKNLRPEEVQVRAIASTDKFVPPKASDA